MEGSTVSITGVQTSGIADRIQRSPRHRLRFWIRLIISRFQSSEVIDTQPGSLRAKVIDTPSRDRKVIRLMNGTTLHYYGDR
jgi:hypothetical protein